MLTISGDVDGLIMVARRCKRQGRSFVVVRGGDWHRGLALLGLDSQAGDQDTSRVVLVHSGGLRALGCCECGLHPDLLVTSLVCVLERWDMVLVCTSHFGGGSLVSMISPNVSVRQRP